MRKEDSAMLCYLLGVLTHEVNCYSFDNVLTENDRLEMLDAILKVQSYLYNEYEKKNYEKHQNTHS